MKTGIYKLPSNFGGGLNYLSQDALKPNESPGPVSNWAPFVLPKSSGLSGELHGGIETLNKFPGVVEENRLADRLYKTNLLNLPHPPPWAREFSYPYYIEGFGIYRFTEDLEHPEGGFRNQLIVLAAPWHPDDTWVRWPRLFYAEVVNGEIKEFWLYHEPEPGLYFPHAVIYNVIFYKEIAVILPSYEMMNGYYGHWKTNIGWRGTRDAIIKPVGAMGYGRVDPSSSTLSGELEPTKQYYYFVVWTNMLIGRSTELGEEGGVPRNAQLGRDFLGATAGAGGAIDLDFEGVVPPDWADGALIYRTGPHEYQQKNWEYMSNVSWMRCEKVFGKQEAVFHGGTWVDRGGQGAEPDWESAPPQIYRNAPVARCGAVWQDSLWLAGFPESPFIDYPPKPSPWDGDAFHPHWLIRSRPGTFNFADHNYGWNYIDLGSAGGDENGIAVTETQLLVFRNHQIHRIRVHGNSYENRIISTDKGVANQQAIAIDGENVYFYDYLGNTIWRYNGVDFQDVGFKLSPYLQREQTTGYGTKTIQHNYRLYIFDGRLYVSRFHMGDSLKPQAYETHVGEFRGNDVVWTRLPWGAMFFADTTDFGMDGLMGDMGGLEKPALLIAGRLNESDPVFLRHNDVTKYEDAYTGETLQLVWPSVWSDFDLPGFIKRIATIRFNVEHFRESGGDTLLRILIYKDHEKERIFETTVTIKSRIYKYEVVVPNKVRGESFQIRFSERDINQPNDYLKVKAPVLINYFWNENQHE